MTPDGRSLVVPITGSPFEIGRGEAGPESFPDRLALEDRRVSRQAGLILAEADRFLLRDLGQRNGLFLNQEPVAGKTALSDGDVITFGLSNAVRLVFRSGTGKESLSSLLTRLDESRRKDTADQPMQQLSLLLEATALLQTEMPIAEILGTMVDQAIRITAAERGVLFEADPEGQLRILVTRHTDSAGGPPASWIPSKTAMDRAIADRQAFIELDLDQAGGEPVRMAESIVNQRLRSVIAIPLYSRHAAPPSNGGRGALLGLLYMDSRQPSAFRGLGRQVLEALAIEAAGVIDNARMFEREQERRQMEQDLSIAREIQQKLLPREFRRYRAIQVTGVNESCHSVGGDYFDVMEPGSGHVAFVVADVTGKGLPAALLTAMLQGGFAGIALAPDLATLVSHVNRYVWGRSESNRFATAFVGVLDVDGRLEYINAGHLPALLVRTNGEVERLGSGCLPIGVFPETRFTSVTCTLGRGDTLVAFTDGLTESTNRGGEEFGMLRLEEILARSVRLRVDEIQDRLLASVRDFSVGQESEDDMTLLVVRYSGDDADLPETGE